MTLARLSHFGHGMLPGAISKQYESSLPADRLAAQVMLLVLWVTEWQFSLSSFTDVCLIERDWIGLLQKLHLRKCS